MTTKKTDDLFSEENEARADSSFFKFEKIGDTVRGTVISKRVQPPKGDFPEQDVYELKQEDGSSIMVGLSKPYNRRSAKNVKFGQIMGVKYDSDFETPESKKGVRSPAKTYKVYLGDMDTSYNPTDGLNEVNPDDLNF